MNLFKQKDTNKVSLFDITSTFYRYLFHRKVLSKENNQLLSKLFCINSNLGLVDMESFMNLYFNLLDSNDKLEINNIFTLTICELDITPEYVKSKLMDKHMVDNSLKNFDDRYVPVMIGELSVTQFWKIEDDRKQ